MQFPRDFIEPTSIIWLYLRCANMATKGERANVVTLAGELASHRGCICKRGPVSAAHRRVVSTFVVLRPPPNQHPIRLGHGLSMLFRKSADMKIANHSSFRLSERTGGGGHIIIIVVVPRAHKHVFRTCDFCWECVCAGPMRA